MKLTKECVGKKVRVEVWGPGRWFYCGHVGLDGIHMYGENQDRSPNNYLMNMADHWEFYEEPKQIPESQAWVVPGKKYQLLNSPYAHVDASYFSPIQYDFVTNFWIGEDEKRHYRSYAMHSKCNWKEYTPTVRMAPAILRGNPPFITSTLYKSLEEAQKDYPFVKWPASENLFVEVPADD